ncbi:MAG: hypothetical protein CM1200mP40_11660 [Gammaproteobacteria bacterium]|nr:MAG: hypothetical protein CM1200mP40_11660 [Gammaproteobacteria bacterium]
MQEAAESDSASMAAARSQKALENLRERQQELEQETDRSVNQLAQNLVNVASNYCNSNVRSGRYGGYNSSTRIRTNQTIRAQF